MNCAILLIDVAERHRTNRGNCVRQSKKEAVIELLRRNTDGLTIIDIADELGFSRNTVAVALAELKGAGAIRIRPVGMAKLHYLIDAKMRGGA